MVNENRKPDRRIAKTKKSICTAFLLLLSKKNINKITIKDIADTADVNRKTFYNYFNGIYEVTNEIKDLVLKHYDLATKNIISYRSIDDFKKLFNSLTEIFNENILFYKNLFNLQTDCNLQKQIISLFKEKVKENFLKTKLVSYNDLDLIVTYIVSAIWYSYQYYFNYNKTDSVETFSNNLSCLVYNGIGPFIVSRK